MNSLLSRCRKALRAPEAAGVAGTGRSQRQLRVGELIRQVVSQVLARGDTFDPDLEGIAITVSEVQCSPDLRHATAFVMPLSGSDNSANHGRIIKALNRNRAQFQEALARELTIKFTPKLFFKLETSFDNADQINSVFRRIEQKDSSD